MKKSAWRLAVAAILFAAWIGYLAFLAATTTEPIVLSRTQFLAAELYVEASVSADPANANKPSDVVMIKQVVWSADAADAKRTTVKVKGLGDVNEQRGWKGPGEYILALSRTKEGGDAVALTPVPRTPGFPGAGGRIYEATPTTRRQLELLAKQYHSAP